MFIALSPEPPEVDGTDLVTTPNGTVTITIDRKAGVLRVYSEIEPDPGDWDTACQYIRRVGGQMAGAWTEGEVDVFQVSVNPATHSCCALHYEASEASLQKSRREPLAAIIVTSYPV